MTRMNQGRAVVAAVMVAAAMALAGVGIAHIGQVEPTQLVISDRSLTVEDKVTLVAGDEFDVTVEGREERSRGSYE